MRWTDWSYYYEIIDVPNLNEIGDKDDSLDIYIAKYEREALHLMMGECMVKELYNNIETDPLTGLWILKNPNNANFEHLISGYEYEYDQSCSPCTDCKTFYWRGLRHSFDVWSTIDNAPKQIKISPLAYYVYYKWLIDRQSYTTVFGEKNGQTSNAKSVDNTMVRVRVWNLFMEYAFMGTRQGHVGLFQFVIDQNKIAEENNEEKPFPDFCPNRQLQTINLWEA